MTTVAQRLEQFKSGTGMYAPIGVRRAVEKSEIACARKQAYDLARTLRAARSKLVAAHEIADVLAKMGRGQSEHAPWCKFVASELRSALGARPKAEPCERGKCKGEDHDPVP